MYVTGLGCVSCTLGDAPSAVGPFMLAAVDPSPAPAGPGQQVLTVYGTGLQLGFNLAIYPNFNPPHATAQGYGAPLYDVSSDGTSALALVDFGGDPGSWTAQVISPYTSQQSNPVTVTTVVGAVEAVNQAEYFFQSGQMTPVIALPTTQLVAAQNSQGQPTNYVVVTGGTASIPDQNGNAQVVTSPGAGLWVDSPPGTWTFVPAAQAMSLVAQYFDVDLPNLDTCYNGQTDVFGLPLITPTCPGDLAWVDVNGHPVASPWSTAAPPAIGSVIAQDASVYYGAAPVTAVAVPSPSAYAEGSVAANVDQSPAGAAPSAAVVSTAPVATVPVATVPVEVALLPDGTVPATGPSTVELVIGGLIGLWLIRQATR